MNSSEPDAPLIAYPVHESTPRWFTWLMLLGSIGIFAVALLLRPAPGDSLRLSGFSQPLPQICMLRRLTGWSCPGCGLTRSVVSSFRGHFVEAVRHNPAGPMFAVIFAFQIPYRIYELFRGKSARAGTIRKPLHLPGGIYFVALTFVVMVLQWILRPIWT